MKEKLVTWVVYLMTLRKGPGIRAICEQSEWDALERARPGYHQLLLANIACEVEAEMFARGDQTLGIVVAKSKLP